MTKHYSLTTWMGQQMVHVDRMTAAEDVEAIAYARGRLDERHQGPGGAALQLGVTYRLDRQKSDDPMIDLTSQSRVGDWFPVKQPYGCELLWIEHHDERSTG